MSRRQHVPADQDRDRDRGTGLIEILVAIVLLGLGASRHACRDRRLQSTVRQNTPN
jgi:prepilin-type N-terminal cleavage/methylation domain-containing protein